MSLFSPFGPLSNFNVPGGTAEFPDIEPIRPPTIRNPNLPPPRMPGVPWDFPRDGYTWRREMPPRDYGWRIPGRGPWWGPGLAIGVIGGGIMAGQWLQGKNCEQARAFLIKEIETEIRGTGNLRDAVVSLVLRISAMLRVEAYLRMERCRKRLDEIRSDLRQMLDALRWLDKYLNELLKKAQAINCSGQGPLGFGGGQIEQMQVLFEELQAYRSQSSRALEAAMKYHREFLEITKNPNPCFIDPNAPQNQ